MNLVLLTLLSAAVEVQGSTVNAVGWSQDGRYFVWSSESVFVEDPYGLIDTRTGSSETLSEDDLKAWKAKHPLAPLVQDRRSPDGQATVDVKPIAGKVTGGWNAKPNGESPANFTWTPATATASELRVDRGAQSWVSVAWNGSVYAVKPYWSPDSRQVAWVLRPSDWQGMDGTATFQILIGPGGFPRVHVVTEKALVPTAGAKVKELLDAKGFSTTYVGQAMKARDASVVYCAPGREELAKKAAALIPGGATVDKLTWAANAELVVALGKKAVAP